MNSVLGSIVAGQGRIRRGKVGAAQQSPSRVFGDPQPGLLATNQVLAERGVTSL